MIMINQIEIQTETVNVPFQCLYQPQLKFASEGEL